MRDTVVFGVGEFVDSDFFKLNGIEIQPFQHKTNFPNVFCTGDLVSDEKSVVHSVGTDVPVRRKCFLFLTSNFIPSKKTDYYKHEKVDLFCHFLWREVRKPLRASGRSSD